MHNKQQWKTDRQVLGKKTTETEKKENESVYKPVHQLGTFWMHWWKQWSFQPALQQSACWSHKWPVHGCTATADAGAIHSSSLCSCDAGEVTETLWHCAKLLSLWHALIYYSFIHRCAGHEAQACLEAISMISDFISAEFHGEYIQALVAVACNTNIHVNCEIQNLRQTWQLKVKNAHLKVLFCFTIHTAFAPLYIHFILSLVLIYSVLLLTVGQLNIVPGWQTNLLLNILCTLLREQLMSATVTESSKVSVCWHGSTSDLHKTWMKMLTGITNLYL